MDIDARLDAENNQNNNNNKCTGRDYVARCIQKRERSTLKLFGAGVSVLLLFSSLIFLKMNVYASVVADPTATPSTTVTQSDTTTTTATPSSTVTDTPSPDPTITDTPSPSPTVTDTPSSTPTVTRTPRHTPTPQPSPMVTDTPQPTGTTATPQGGNTPQATPTVQVTRTPALQNSGAGQTPTSNLTPTLNAGGNMPDMPQSQNQGGGMFPFSMFILIAILAGFGIISAITIAAIFIRQRALTPLKLGTNLPPSGAQPWQRIRDSSLSLDGNTNLYGEPIINSAPTVAIQQGFMSDQNAPFVAPADRGMVASARAGFLSSLPPPDIFVPVPFGGPQNSQNNGRNFSTPDVPFAAQQYGSASNTNADFHVSPSPTPFAFATDNLLPASGSLPAVRNNQQSSGYLNDGIGANDLLPESDVFPAVQNYQQGSASPDDARGNFPAQSVSISDGFATSDQINRPHYKRGALRLRAMENSGSGFGDT